MIQVYLLFKKHQHIYQFSGFYVDGQLYDAEADTDKIDTAVVFFKDGLSYAGRLYREATYEFTLDNQQSWAWMDHEFPKTFAELERTWSHCLKEVKDTF